MFSSSYIVQAKYTYHAYISYVSWFLNSILLQVLTFLLYSYSVWKIGIETMFILLNPVLSDSFGLTVKETGYYFTGLMVAYIAGPFIL